MSEDRLDRLETLAEKILEGLQETRLVTHEIAESLQETRLVTHEIAESLQETRLVTRKIAEGLQETRQLLAEGLQETKHLTNSNARAIEALATQSAENQKQWERDRKGIYLLLGQLTRSMSDFYDTQSDFYNRFDQIDARQLEIAKIIEHFKTDQTDQENQD